MQRQSRPTIVDVARAAGVSVATVSYVLSGKKPIGEQTQLRVRDAIETLSYRPNPNAQGLKASRNHLLSVIVSDWRETLILKIIEGIESVAREHGYHLAVNSLEEFGNDVQQAVNHLTRRAIDGVIFASGVAHDRPLDVPGLDVPIVGVNRPIGESFPCVLCDNTDGGYRAARHLLEQGATSLAIIVGPDDRAASRNRLTGFKRALKDEGIRLPSNRVYRGNFESESGYQGLLQLIAHSPDLDGLFCTNDTMAAGAIAAAMRTGIRVPEQLRIIGFDNEKFASLLPIPLTSLSLPGVEMARTATQTLIGLIEDREALFTQVKVRSVLHERASTIGLT